MEIFIILVAVGIIGFVIYQNSPGSKFNSAERLLSSGNVDGASKIFESLLNKHADAASRLAECYLKKTKKTEISSYNIIFEIPKRINGNFNRDAYEVVEAKAKYEIAHFQFEEILATRNQETSTRIEKLRENIKFINNCNKKGSEDEFNTLRNKHLIQIGIGYFEKGKEFERQGHNLEAISSYSEALASQPSGSRADSYYDITTRREICRLKIGEVSDHDSIAGDIAKASESFKRDFYYRYVLKVAKSNILKAQELTNRYLPSEDAKIKLLKNYFLNEKKKLAKGKLDQVNKSLESLFELQFPADKTKEFYDSLSVMSKEISDVLPEAKQKLEEIKPSLFNKLLISSLERNDYSTAISLITSYPRFWTVPELLKNLGICCFGIANKGGLNESNYKTVISSWLTAVYSDKVILKSLEATTWDDDYTFSLAESIGSQYSNHAELPNNANYDEITDANISIGATQRELLLQFEATINNKLDNEEFAKKVHDLYETEKNSIESIIEVIPNDILFASPLFARQYSEVASEIINELNADYDQYENEDTLKAGVPYVDYQKYKDEVNPVTEYRKATVIKHSFISALKTLETDKLMEISKDTEKRKLVNKYPKFRDNFEEEVFNYFNRKIEEDDENEKLIAPLAQSINLFNVASKLRYQYSNFVTNLTISKVNDEKMNNFKALQNLRNAYMCKKDIARVCKNLVAVIKFNLLDIINDRATNSTEVYKILDEIQKEKSPTYKAHCAELTKIRRELLAQFPAQARTVILAGTNLNADGLKIRKALKYMVDLGDGDDFTDLSDLFAASR